MPNISAEKDYVSSILSPQEQEVKVEVQNTQSDNKMSRRGFMMAAFGAGVTTPAVLATPQTAEGYSPEKEYQDLVTEIDAIWGFKILNSYGSVDIEELRSMRESLLIFPPGFAYMLGHTITPIINQQKTTADISYANGLEIEFVDFKSIGRPDLGGDASYTNAKIRIDPSFKQTSTILYHELGHFLHATIGGPIITTSPVFTENKWAEVTAETAQLNGFIHSYGTKNPKEDFATTLEWLLSEGKYYPNRANNYPELSPEAKLKIEILKEALAMVTNGRMDKEYFKDLAEGRVNNLGYWENKKSSDFWTLRLTDEMSIYMTDLDKKDPFKNIPAVITAIQKKKGSFSEFAEDPNGETTTNIGGKEVSITKSPITNEITLSVDDYQQVLVIPEKNCEVYISVNTPAIKFDLLVTNDEGNVYIKRGIKQVKNPQEVAKDDYSGENLEKLITWTDSDKITIGYFGIALLGIPLSGAMYAALDNGKSGITRRALLSFLGSFTFISGIEVLPGVFSKEMRDTQSKTIEKLKLYAQLKKKSLAEYNRVPPFIKGLIDEYNIDSKIPKQQPIS